MSIFKKKEKPLDSVSTTTNPINLLEVENKIKSQNQKWIDAQDKENRRINAENKPRVEAMEKTREDRKAAAIERFEVNRMQGKFNNNVKLIEDLVQENREYEKEIGKYGGWKKAVKQNQAEWNKTFPCEAPTQYEIEDRSAILKGQGYKQNAQGKWYLSEARKELNSTILQEINNNLR